MIEKLKGNFVQRSSKFQACRLDQKPVRSPELFPEPRTCTQNRYLKVRHGFRTNG